MEESVKVVGGSVNEQVLDRFPHRRGSTLMNHAANTCGIEETLSVGAVYWPRLVEAGGCVFVAEFFTQSLDGLLDRFDGDRSAIERWVNAWSLQEFFLQSRTSAVDDGEVLQEFGRVLRFFWQQRLRFDYPESTFVVEVDNGIEGENGLAITFYQVRHQE
ncbi:hypothetical protein AB0N05_04855 [Nocardia sp. NPDC051030]|uniref:hypothetical protein n=1 Tax=Nocardia sp. NPDC051030 TaxID=3155162 RepID=UPI003415AD7F